MFLSICLVFKFNYLFVIPNVSVFYVICRMRGSVTYVAQNLEGDLVRNLDVRCHLFGLILIILSSVDLNKV